MTQKFEHQVANKPLHAGQIYRNIMKDFMQKQEANSNIGKAFFHGILIDKKRRRRMFKVRRKARKFIS